MFISRGYDIDTDLYRIYDTEDLSITEASSAQINGYLLAGIKIAGVWKNNIACFGTCPCVIRFYDAKKNAYFYDGYTFMRTRVTHNVQTLLAEDIIEMLVNPEKFMALGMELRVLNKEWYIADINKLINFEGQADYQYRGKAYTEYRTEVKGSVSLIAKSDGELGWDYMTSCEADFSHLLHILLIEENTIEGVVAVSYDAITFSDGYTLTWEDNIRHLYDTFVTTTTAFKKGALCGALKCLLPMSKLITLEELNNMSSVYFVLDNNRQDIVLIKNQMPDVGGFEKSSGLVCTVDAYDAEQELLTCNGGKDMYYFCELASVVHTFRDNSCDNFKELVDYMETRRVAEDLSDSSYWYSLDVDRFDWQPNIVGEVQYGNYVMTEKAKGTHNAIPPMGNHFVLGDTPITYHNFSKCADCFSVQAGDGYIQVYNKDTRNRWYMAYPYTCGFIEGNVHSRYGFDLDTWCFVDATQGTGTLNTNEIPAGSLNRLGDEVPRVNPVAFHSIEKKGDGFQINMLCSYSFKDASKHKFINYIVVPLMFCGVEVKQFFSQYVIELGRSVLVISPSLYKQQVAELNMATINSMEPRAGTCDLDYDYNYRIFQGAISEYVQK